MKQNRLEMFGVGAVDDGPHWHMPAHQHPKHHELIIIHAGSMILRTPETEITAQRGEVLFYRARLIHEEISDPHNAVSTIFISFRGPVSHPQIPLHLRDLDGRIREMAGWLLQNTRSGLAFQDSQPIFNALIAEIYRLNAAPIDPWLQNVRHYLSAHFAASLTLEKIARHFGISPFSFIRKYRRLSGNTPMQELRQIRLNEARQMLLTSGAPLKQIAPAVGLGDEYQLSKLFRKHFRLSPSEIRLRQSI